MYGLDDHVLHMTWQDACDLQQYSLYALRLGFVVVVCICPGLGKDQDLGVQGSVLLVGIVGTGCWWRGVVVINLHVVTNLHFDSIRFTYDSHSVLFGGVRFDSILIQSGSV